MRRVVALGLGRIRIRQFPVALEALSADPDLFVRAAAVESVGAIAENASGPTFDTAVSLLVKRLEEQSIPQYNLRHSSVRSLESIAASHPEQISIIIRWASEAAHKEFRREMLSSLGNVAKRMRADSAEAKLILDALIERLGVERQLEIRVAIVHALGVIPGKPASAERALQSVLDEPQEEIVRAARSLLKNWRRPTVEPDR